jgi:hypothetical protein
VTIDVERLRYWASTGDSSTRWANVTRAELTELLDAYEELHRYDADMEAGGDWLPLHLREAVAGLEPEQRVVVTEWYWRTNLLIGALQTERDRLRAALAEQGLLQKKPGGGMVWHAHDCPASFDFAQCNYRCRVARAAMEGRE